MKVTRTERLLNLVIALLAADVPVSRAIIQSSVAGYDPQASVAAFERMFERDKDELRGMGIPIRTVFDPGGEVLGYLIDAKDYQQQTIDLTVEELTVISLAARVWDEAVLAPAAVTALRKLEALSPQGMMSTPPQTFGSLAIKEAAFLPLLRAVRDRRVVNFDYRKPGEDFATRRTVEPWSISSKEGHWYLEGWDADRLEPRSYRLSRIEGQVTLTSRPCEMPVGVRDSHVETEETEELVEALVHIPSGTGSQLQRYAGSHPLGSDRWRIKAPRRELVRMILRADPSITIEEPMDLRRDVASAAEAIAQVHA